MNYTIFKLFFNLFINPYKKYFIYISISDIMIQLILEALEEDPEKYTAEELYKKLKVSHIKEFQRAILDISGLGEQDGNKQQMMKERINAIRQAKQNQRTSTGTTE